MDFDCPAFGCDGGDCPSASECGTDAPTPSGPRERDVYAATIEEIQRRATLDFEDDDGDDASIVFDCSRSVLSHRVVRVSGVVSAVAGTGFYFQDGVGPWNGLFAHAGSTAAVLSALRVGDVVDVVGYVDEHLGQTQVEVAGDDAFGVAVVGRTAPYAAVDVRASPSSARSSRSTTTAARPTPTTSNSTRRPGSARRRGARCGGTRPRTRPRRSSSRPRSTGRTRPTTRRRASSPSSRTRRRASCPARI